MCRPGVCAVAGADPGPEDLALWGESNHFRLSYTTRPPTTVITTCVSAM
jgi:hypothetical protein